MASVHITAGNAPAPVTFDLNGSIVTNEGDATVYYNDQPDVSASVNDGSLADGASVTLYGTQYLWVESGRARVRYMPATDTIAWRRGSGSPPSAVGENGDWYVDDDTGDQYGPKAAGAWPGSPAGGGGGGGSTLTGVYDVIASYNAVGDGVADDTAAIQAAINDAKAGGGTVYLPPGSYKVTAALDCSNSSKAFRVTGLANGGRGHINAGSPTILWTGAAGSGPVLKAYSVHGFELDHLHFVYTVDGYDGDIVDLDGGPLASDCTNWELHHLSFRGQQSGLHFQSARSTIRLNKAIIGDIHHCHFADAENGLRVGDPGGSYVVGVQFRSNTYNNNTDAHVLVGTADGEALTFDGEVFEAGNNTTAIRGATTAGDGGQNQLYDFAVVNSWFGDASLPVTWIKDLHTVAGKPVLIQNNRFASNGSTDQPHLSGDGVWLVQGNSFEGGDIFQYVSGGASTTILLLVGNQAVVRKKVNNLSSSLTVYEWGNAFGYNATYTQTADNTATDRVGSSRFAIGGLGKPAQPNLAATDTNEDLVLGAFVNAFTTGSPADKGFIGVGKTPNPAALRSIIQIAPWSGAAGGWSVFAGAGPYNVIQAQGGASQAACKLGFNGVSPIARPAAYTQNYATADRTLGAYVADAENVAYTGAADGEAKLADLNALRAAYENLRAFTEDLAQQHNSILDDLQAYGLLQ